MYKKLAIALIVGLCMTASVAFADQHYQDRNVFNKTTDWYAGIWKTDEQKQDIINKRVEQRAEKRKADEAYQNKKQELKRAYDEKLLSITNENIPAEDMAEKINNATADHKKNLKDLYNDYKK